MFGLFGKKKPVVAQKNEAKKSEIKQGSQEQKQETKQPLEYFDRLKKLEEMRAAGVQPYPERYERSHTATEAQALGEKGMRETEEVTKGGVDGASRGTEISLAGRIMTFRSHGKLSFAQLQDISGRVQICFMKDVLGEEKYKFAAKKVDAGDFLGVKGELFRTQHGEVTLLVREYILLAKSLQPLPEKWHGVQDQEMKYRYRYLDMLMSPETTQRMLLRSKFIRTVRKYLEDNQFIEVETPILAAKASGALAKPFVTHHNALDREFFLRIAPETYLKRAVVGGFERVFEFAKCFRNEGMDPSHLQEFTMLEYYASYWNYEDNMDFTENLFKYFIKELFGTLTIQVGENQIDFGQKWPRKSLRDLIFEKTAIDINTEKTAEDLRKAIKKNNIVLEDNGKLGRGNLIDILYKKTVRPQLIQPIFVTSHPIDLSPLARRNDTNPDITDRFQLVVNSWEVVNAYSELVDPVDQRQRFEYQAKLKANGDEEAMEADYDYVYAMEHGMPPMSGWGMGVDRILALLTNQENLKDVILFPLMKPLDE